MKFLVGLGNPGDKYADNRHNIGFMVVDEIVHHHGFGPWRARFQGVVAEGTIDAARCLALKPDTYMNRSGQSVGEALRYYKAAPEQIIVFHDELDLAPGKMRVKTGGGHGGHNGLRDIEAHIGPDFTRVRLGIGHPGDKTLVERYVLSDFAKSDDAWLDPMIAACARHMAFLIHDQADKFMSSVALDTQGDEPPTHEDAEPDGI